MSKTNTPVTSGLGKDVLPVVMNHAIALRFKTLSHLHDDLQLLIALARHRASSFLGTRIDFYNVPISTTLPTENFSFCTLEIKAGRLKGDTIMAEACLVFGGTERIPVVQRGIYEAYACPEIGIALYALDPSMGESLKQSVPKPFYPRPSQAPAPAPLKKFPVETRMLAARFLLARDTRVCDLPELKRKHGLPGNIFQRFTFGLSLLTKETIDRATVALHDIESHPLSVRPKVGGKAMRQHRRTLHELNIELPEDSPWRFKWPDDEIVATKEVEVLHVKIGIALVSRKIPRLVVRQKHGLAVSDLAKTLRGEIFTDNIDLLRDVLATVKSYPSDSRSTDLDMLDLLQKQLGKLESA